MTSPAEEIERWRIDVSYDGADFSGWAVQPGFRTVQGELEHWISQILRLDTPARLVCAGRTDAGVHARGQVVHCDLPAGAVSGTGAELARRLRRVSPPDLLVREVSPAPAGFDARFAAVWRRYVYRIAEASLPLDPLLRNQVTRLGDELDLSEMNAAAPLLLGLRNFGTFCRRREGATTIRTLLELRSDRVLGGPMNGVVECTVRADAFCHSMVRSLVGALVTVGSGRRDRDWLAAVTQGAVRDPTVTVLPPGGLTLEEVRYPDDAGLSARVRESRTARELIR